MKSPWLSWERLLLVRKLVQLAFFSFFIYLVFAGMSGHSSVLADFFFLINPLSALTAGLASRTWIHGMEWALVTVGVTLAIGRVWCGWICPLGTLLEWTRFRGASRRSRRLSQKLRIVKYFLLAIILAMALFAGLSLLIFEPVSIITRFMTAAAVPAITYAVTAAESMLYGIPFLRPLVDGLESLLRGVVLPARQPAFVSPLPIALLFGALLALNFLADRFWCRYLCPLGALLGWLAKFSLFRPSVGSSCTGCSRCALACRPGAIQVTRHTPSKTIPAAEIKTNRTLTTALPTTIDAAASSPDLNLSSLSARGNIPLAVSPDLPSVNPAAEGSPVGITAVPSRPRPDIDILQTECTMCLDCLAACPNTGIQIQPIFKPVPAQEYDLGRRNFLQALGAGAAAVLLLRVDDRLRVTDLRLIRPPGVTDEAAFLSQCIRCSECMNACPTTALQPAWGEAGLEGLWTPVVAPRIGYCDYGCSLCGQVCPSGAIPALSLEEKRQQVIGLASVDRNRCLAWAYNTPCIVCEEMCPTPQKSIRLEVATVQTEGGESIQLQRPYILNDLCIGCGICENHCPLDGPAAIQVYAVRD